MQPRPQPPLTSTDVTAASADCSVFQQAWQTLHFMETSQLPDGKLTVPDPFHLWGTHDSFSLELIAIPDKSFSSLLMTPLPAVLFHCFKNAKFSNIGSFTMLTQTKAMKCTSRYSILRSTLLAK